MWCGVFYFFCSWRKDLTSYHTCMITLRRKIWLNFVKYFLRVSEVGANWDSIHMHFIHTHFYVMYNLAFLPLSCSLFGVIVVCTWLSPSLVCKILCIFIFMQLPPTPMTACAASYSEMQVTFSADTLWPFYPKWTWWALYICIEIVFEEAAEETLTSKRQILFCSNAHASIFVASFLSFQLLWF